MTVRLRGADGRSRRLPVARWLGEATDAERAALLRLTGPVLDVGCGPGRHVAALNHAGVVALGIDTSPVAVGLAQSRGAAALVRSVFGRVPGAGRWRAAVLLDGNLGIGGDPVALLRRVADLLVPGGLILVETEAGAAVERSAVRIEADGGGAATGWFPWAVVGTGALSGLAAAAGLQVVEQWEAERRWFGAVAT